MTLTYWVARTRDHSEAYNIRRKTRKAVVEALESGRFGNREYGFGPVHKVTVKYSDAFDLMNRAMGEGSISEGTE